MKTLIFSILTSLVSTLASWSGSLEFAQISKQVDVPVKQTRIVVEYPFTNTSDKHVSIRRFDAPCACLTAEATGGTKNTNGSVEYSPGESGAIKGILDLGKFKGTIEKKILVWTDADKESNPSIQLNMEVKVPYEIAAFPQALSWKTGGSITSKEFKIKVMGDKPINILSHKSSSKDINYKVETVKKGYEYKVTVTPNGTTKPLFASLRFSTDSKNPRSKRLNCFVSVKD